MGVGASAGGLDAFKEFLAALPEQTGMAFVLIQHLDPTYESQLTEILQKATPLPVITVTEGLAIEQNKVYIIPPNTSMVLRDCKLHLAPRERGLHLPIDIFFRSLAEQQGSRSIGIVLSGNASDGSQGLRAIKAECGITFAQTESTAAFESMPRCAIATGAVDFVLSPAEIAQELGRLGHHPYLASPELDGNAPEALPDGEADLRKIFSLIQNATKVDFSQYKRTTIRRRIGRRMMVHHMRNLSEYVRYADENRGELRELYRDLLITVTSFFREPGTFAALTALIRARMLEGKPRRERAIRVWVPGCSTGEEVYSLAISLYELLQEMRLGVPLQLFGTDISELALERARSGNLYRNSHARRLAREAGPIFFKSGRRVSNQQTDSGKLRVCSAGHYPGSALFTYGCDQLPQRADLHGAALQRRVLPIFHYGLNPDGLLMLGSAESTSLAEDLFTVVDKPAHVYGRKAASVRMMLDVSLGRPFPEQAPEISDARAAERGLDVQKRVDRIIQSKYSPDAVVIGSDLQILQFRGRTSSYLEPSPGDASLSLLRMARESLVVPLRRVIQTARDRGVAALESCPSMEIGAERRNVTIEVTPIPGSSAADTHYLVVFATLDRQVVPEPGPAAAIPGEDEGELYVRQLRREMAETREYLRYSDCLIIPIQGQAVAFRASRFGR